MKIRFLLPLVGILFFLIGLGARAGVIENVNITPFPDRSVIEVDLSARLAYRSHSPQSRGDLLVIQLQPMDDLSAIPGALTRQSYPWKKSSGVPLSEVVYDSNPGGLAQISLRFRLPVEFSVEGNPDGTRLQVTVYSDQKGVAETDGRENKALPGPGTIPEASPGIVPMPPKTRPEGMTQFDLDQQMERLMAEGKTGIIQGEYAAAARFYEQALQLPNNPSSMKALEYLGLARELNGERRSAEFVYRAFLQRYPEGKAHDQVAQRLQSIVTADQAPKKPLHKGKASGSESEPPFPAVQDKVQTDFYGSFSNFYNGFVLQTNEGAELVQSSVQADLFLTGSVQTENWRFRMNFTGGQLFNTIGDRGAQSATRITNGYLDILQEAWGFNARLGRQVGYNGGVLGRFDGINAGYLLNETLRLNMVFGFPVEYSSVTRENQDNVFYGFNTDILNVQGPLESSMDFNLYFIQQFIEGLQDRLAVGGDIRFFRENINFYSQIDYDILFNTLNIATFNGNWLLPSNTNLNLLLDYRKAPILTTSNALLGNFLVEDIDGLRALLSTDQIRDLAKQNSVDSATFTLGASHPINDRFQVNADFTATRLNQIPNTEILSVSGQPLVDIEGIIATGWEYFVNTQLIGSNLFETGDFLSLGFRYARLQTSNRYGININSRIPFSPDFDISPRFRIDHRRGQQNVNDWTFAPSIRARYRVTKGFQLEGEFGAEFITDNIADDIGSFTDGNYYFLIGYRLDFPELL